LANPQYLVVTEINCTLERRLPQEVDMSWRNLVSAYTTVASVPNRTNVHMAANRPPGSSNVVENKPLFAA